MSIETLIISNLRRAQALDTSLREASGLERIAQLFVDQIMFQPNAAKRSAAIIEVQKRLIEHAVSEVLPQAERIGTKNAADIIAKTPKPVDLLSETKRRAVLFEGKIRAEERVQQVKLSVKEQADKLDTRLTRYYLQPAEGTAKEKVERLRDIHKRLEERRKTFEANKKKFNAGEIKTRPSKPNLDFMSELTAEVKADVKTQARRAATDAEIAMFRARGHSKLGWTVPNGHSACPDCQVRAGVVLTIEDWERYGRPGSGMTICEDACFCMLIPAETFKRAPGLKFTFRGVKTVLTTPAQRAVFDANRAA